MGNFRENMLRDEELSAGFNPGEPDDDTFTVPASGYPSSLPHLSDIEADDDNISDDIINEALNLAPKAAKTPPPNVVTSAEQIEIPDEGSVWDAFGFDEEPSKEVKSEVESVADAFDEPEYFEESEPDQKIAETESVESPAIDDFNDNFDEAPEPEQTNIPEEISLSPDADLQKIIMQDMERGKKKKNAPKQKAVVEDREFKPVDEADDAKIIDISNIDIEDNYNKIIGEQSSKSAAAQPKKAEVKEDKNKKRGFPWKLAAFSAVALFVMTIGVLIYYILNYQPEIANKLGLMSDETYAEKIGNDSTIVKNEKVSKPNKEKNTVKSAEKNVEKDAEKASDSLIEKDANQKIDDFSSLDKAKQDSINADIEAYKKEMEKQNTDKMQIAKTDYNINKPKSNIADNTISEPKKKVEKPKSEKPKSKPKNKDLVSANTKIISQENPNNVTNANPETSKTDKSLKTLNQLEEEGTFVVQIYSTPSKDDAQEWLDKLRSKNLSGYISEHKVRDIIWYRVRFGEFSSKDEARAAAMRYGFAQSWIDRIR